jgi:hypothetical protein
LLDRPRVKRAELSLIELYPAKLREPLLQVLKKLAQITAGGIPLRVR